MDREEQYAAIHERLAGTPLAAAFAVIQAEAEDFLDLASAVQTDFECEVWDELCQKAGLLWRCPSDDCGIANSRYEPACDGCGTPRPEESAADSLVC